MPIKPPPKPVASHAASEPFAALLAPFAALAKDKQDVLRDVLQIYVSKDSGKHTDLEKRKRLTAVINNHVKGATEEDGA